MTKEEALKQIEELKKFIAEIDNKPSTAAAKWLTQLLPTLTAKYENGDITWYDGNGEWIFQQDYKYNLLRYSYYRIYKILESTYRLDYIKIQQLITDVVAKAYKCEGLTPQG